MFSTLCGLRLKAGKIKEISYVNYLQLSTSIKVMLLVKQEFSA